MAKLTKFDSGGTTRLTETFYHQQKTLAKNKVTWPDKGLGMLRSPASIHISGKHLFLKFFRNRGEERAHVCPHRITG